MEPILARCGYRCDLCLAYAPNIDKHPEKQQVLSDGWFRYFGFRLPPEKVRCDGCMAENPSLIDTACPVRSCVIERGFDNCAQCEDFVCDRLGQRLVDYEEVAQRIGVPILEEDRERFIKPYEAEPRLHALRAARKGS